MDGDTEGAGVIRVAPRPAPQPIPASRGKEAGPKVSCLRCRDQKLKCDRGLPKCVRCRRQRADCTYPSPPDRRRKIRRKTQPRLLGAPAPRPSGVGRFHTPGSDKDMMPLSRASSEEQTGRPGCPCASRPAPSPRHSTDADADAVEATAAAADLPSTEIGLLLLEIYFKRVYNAALLFHKPTVFESYRRNEVPGYLLHAIFAHAAAFLGPAGSAYAPHVKILPIPVLFENAWPWARAASREVLSLADEPTLPRVQALEVLQLFYFSRGEMQRADVHLSLAYRLCRILGFDRLQDGTGLDDGGHGWQFEQERKRRCFWAVWCSLRIANHQVEPPLALEKVPSLPLPASFTATGPLPEAKSDVDRMPWCWKPDQPSLPTCDRKTDRYQVPLMETIVTVLDVWSQVQELQRRLPTLTNSQRKSKVDELAELVDPFHPILDLPWTDIVTQAESFHENPELLLSVCSVYYAVSFLLHALMVPAPTGCSVGPSSCDSSSAKKADMAFQQALSFTRLLRQFITKGFDITSLWPFVGYTAFLAGGVLSTPIPGSKPIKSRGPWLQNARSSAEEVTTAQTVLDVLSIYWKPLRSLGLQLKERMNSEKPGDLLDITPPVYPWPSACGGDPVPAQYTVSKPLAISQPGESTRGPPCVRTLSADPAIFQGSECQPTRSPAQQIPQGPEGCAQATDTDGHPAYHELRDEDEYDFDMGELVASSGDGNHVMGMDWWYPASMDSMLDFSTVSTG